MQAALVFVPMFWLVVVNILLVVAAFRTSLKLGILTLFLPLYVALFGNHRLATPHRVALARAWWIGVAYLLGIVVAARLSSRRPSEGSRRSWFPRFT